MSKDRITIEALVAQPPATVWTRYTSPEHITKWNFASEDWCCPKAEVELKAGGHYLARMEAKDGSFGFDFSAVYQEVVEHERLVMALDDGREVVVTFAAEDGATRVVTEFDPDPDNPTDMQRDGWQAILNNFRIYCERG